ncbi:hypothetical protein GCM10028807_05750 [Spirosoma daeguense]
MNRLFSILLLAGFANFSCAQKVTKETIKQGICGTVVEKRGNHMPSPDSPMPMGQPVQREILIFTLLSISEVETDENGFIKLKGNKKPVKTVQSDKNGKFCLVLPVGSYSLIVREEKGLYANLYDSKNNIFPVNVQKFQRTNVTVEITHQAVF